MESADTIRWHNINLYGFYTCAHVLNKCLQQLVLPHDGVFITEFILYLNFSSKCTGKSCQFELIVQIDHFDSNTFQLKSWQERS